MMKQWALSICCAGIAVAIIQMIIPQMKLKNMISMVLSLLLLLSIASPLFSLGSADMVLDFTPISEQEMSIQATDFTAEAVRMSLKTEITNILSQMGIKAKGVRIDIDVTGPAYNISAITVCIAEEDRDRHDEIASRLREALGQAVYISHNEEDIR